MESSQIINIVLFVGAAQGFLLSAAILGVKRGNKTANVLLAIFLFLFSVLIFFHSAYGLEFHSASTASGNDDYFHNLFLIFGPLIYFYVIALTDKTFRFGQKCLIHFLPVILAFILELILILFDATPEIHKIITPIIVTIVAIQFSLYLFHSVKKLIHHSDELKKSYSSLDKVNLDWLHFLIVAQAIIWPVALIVEILFHDHESWNFIWILVSIFIYMMGYKGFKQPSIFTGKLSEEINETDEPKKKYEKSTLTEEMANIYYDKLLNFMSTNTIFLDTNVTLPILAQRLSISSHHLSQIINEKRNQNFFEFINYYRIEESKKLLSDPEKSNLNISAIAFESGFNTLSSFNSVFKKFTGQTPSQFRNSSK